MSAFDFHSRAHMHAVHQTAHMLMCTQEHIDSQSTHIHEHTHTRTSSTRALRRKPKQINGKQEGKKLLDKSQVGGGTGRRMEDSEYPRITATCPGYSSKGILLSRPALHQTCSSVNTIKVMLLTLYHQGETKRGITFPT